jgi:hypothetical protein
MTNFKNSSKNRFDFLFVADFRCVLLVSSLLCPNDEPRNFHKESSWCKNATSTLEKEKLLLLLLNRQRQGTRKTMHHHFLTAVQFGRARRIATLFAPRLRRACHGFRIRYIRFVEGTRISFRLRNKLFSVLDFLVHHKEQTQRELFAGRNLEGIEERDTCKIRLRISPLRLQRDMTQPLIFQRSVLLRVGNLDSSMTHE